MRAFRVLSPPSASIRDVRQAGHDGCMDEAFVIMQIGNAQLDVVCDEAIDPAIRDAGPAARRVDRHNEGDLLKSEIVQFIERSQIIVADITNERPTAILRLATRWGLGRRPISSSQHARTTTTAVPASGRTVPGSTLTSRAIRFCSGILRTCPRSAVN
jgi:hypothetical protein